MSAKCAACNKPVYFNEQVNALNKKWHKHCFKCQQCGRVLSLGQQLDHKGTGPYCKMCYNSLFAPKGYGYGRAASTFFKKLNLQEGISLHVSTAAVTKTEVKDEKSEDLEKLIELRNKGILTEEQFQEAKKKLENL